jgi:hypothetical protein
MGALWRVEQGLEYIIWPWIRGRYEARRGIIVSHCFTLYTLRHLGFRSGYKTMNFWTSGRKLTHWRAFTVAAERLNIHASRGTLSLRNTVTTVLFHPFHHSRTVQSVQAACLYVPELCRLCKQRVCMFPTVLRNKNKHTPWLLVRKLNIPTDNRRLSTKLITTFMGRGWRVVRPTDPHGH